MLYCFGTRTARTWSRRRPQRQQRPSSAARRMSTWTRSSHSSESSNLTLRHLLLLLVEAKTENFRATKTFPQITLRALSRHSPTSRRRRRTKTSWSRRPSLNRFNISRPTAALKASSHSHRRRRPRVRFTLLPETPRSWWLRRCPMFRPKIRSSLPSCQSLSPPHHRKLQAVPVPVPTLPPSPTPIPSWRRCSTTRASSPQPFRHGAL